MRGRTKTSRQINERELIDRSHQIGVRVNVATRTSQAERGSVSLSDAYSLARGNSLSEIVSARHFFSLAGLKDPRQAIAHGCANRQVAAARSCFG